MNTPGVKPGAHAAGWVPSIQNRTFSQQKPSPMPSLTPLQPEKNGQYSAANQKSHQIAQSALQKAAAAKGVKSAEQDTTWYSIFPVENEELVYSPWEEEIIWDAQAMTKVPAPQMLTLDPNDENIILGVPDDPDPAKMREPQAQTKEKKNPNKDPLRKSRILLGKAGVIAEPEPQSPQPAKEQDQKVSRLHAVDDVSWDPRVLVMVPEIESYIADFISGSLQHIQRRVLQPASSARLSPQTQCRRQPYSTFDSGD